LALITLCKYKFIKVCKFNKDIGADVAFFGEVDFVTIFFAVDVILFLLICFLAVFLVFGL
jgi:hypothetical protein